MVLGEGDGRRRARRHAGGATRGQTDGIGQGGVDGIGQGDTGADGRHRARRVDGVGQGDTGGDGRHRARWVDGARRSACRVTMPKRGWTRPKIGQQTDATVRRARAVNGLEAWGW
jgi:hypothetical protein